MEIITEDQYFLLYFIMGTYFAPDLKVQSPRKSPFQRRAEGLPMYNADKLSNSKMKTEVVQSVYHYILRKAEKSVVVNQPLLLQFIHGNLPIPIEGPSADYPQFDHLFPPNLHTPCDTIRGIVFLHNPEIWYFVPEVIERFKRLTGLEDLNLDRDSAILHMFVDNNNNNNSKFLCNVKVQETSTLDDNYLQNGSPLSSSLVLRQSPVNFSSGEDLDRGTMFLPCCPSKEEWGSLVASTKSGFAVTGSAAEGHFGPVLGLIDIGESEDSYLFRVSLPGVKRDERDFSCEVESNGRVLIKGVTVTGERTVYKYSQAFEMQSRNLCPPGPFSVSFKLPGPVDPRQFHGTFSTDGILEGIALKLRTREK
ncbi:hypothetical protein ACJIZ3_004543 [Penstemon smallii]|uniref:SHSP domain-containing protein n=1 Tax=Penstemon smallii TaxID=265156 RepID=A0ABD3S2K9_9LAMI